MSTPERAGWTSWRKSSYSGGSGNGGCVEISLHTAATAVRDSKNADGPVLVFPSSPWRSFLTRLA